MQNKFFVALFGAMIFASGFLAFAELPPAGSAQSPFARLLQLPALRSFDPRSLIELPTLLIAFIASFLLGLIACVLAIIGWAPRLLAMVSGLLPLGILIYSWFGGRTLVESLGRPLPSGPFSEVLSRFPQIAGWGLWLWLAGAALLLMASLLDSGEDD